MRGLARRVAPCLRGGVPIAVAASAAYTGRIWATAGEGLWSMGRLTVGSAVGGGSGCEIGIMVMAASEARGSDGQEALVTLLTSSLPALKMRRSSLEVRTAAAAATRGVVSAVKFEDGAEVMSDLDCKALL